MRTSPELLLTDAQHRKPAVRPPHHIDAQWLREHCETRRRSMKDIAVLNALHQNAYGEICLDMETRLDTTEATP